MKTEILILSALYYDNNKNGKENKGSRIVYILLDKFADDENYIGYNTITQFSKNNIRKIITKEMIGKPLKAEIQYNSFGQDPNKLYQKLKSVEYNGKVIDLL